MRDEINLLNELSARGKEFLRSLPPDTEFAVFLAPKNSQDITSGVASVSCSEGFMAGIICEVLQQDHDQGGTMLESILTQLRKHSDIEEKRKALLEEALVAASEKKNNVHNLNNKELF